MSCLRLLCCKRSNSFTDQASPMPCDLRQGAEHDRPPNRLTFKARASRACSTPASLSARLVLFSDTRPSRKRKKSDPVAIAGRNELSRFHARLSET